jgi:hypothetical protein
LDAGIGPLLFGGDPRDAELRYIKSQVENEASPPLSMRFHELTIELLDGQLDEAASGYRELRDLHSCVAIGESFGIRANSRSHSHKVADTLLHAERALTNPDFEAQWTKVLECDPAGSFDAATFRRLAPAETLQTLRDTLEEYEIHINGDDRNMTWGDVLELLIIRKRAVDSLDWMPPRA